MGDGEMKNDEMKDSEIKGSERKGRNTGEPVKRLLIFQMFKRKGLQDSFAFFTVGGLVHHLSPAVDVQFNAGIYVYADDGCFRVVQAVTA